MNDGGIGRENRRLDRWPALVAEAAIERNLNDVSEVQLHFVVTNVSENRLKGSFNLASSSPMTLMILLTDASFNEPRGR